MDKLFIIDAVNYLFRSYYAIGPMTDDRGESTNALYGFIRSIQKLVKDFSPQYLVAVFDGPDNQKSRRAVYADYKAHRKETPRDLLIQFERAREFCELYGISVLCVEGVEADDTMASVAVWAQQAGADAYICSSDKDLMQLVNDHLFVIQPHKDNLLVNADKVRDLYGVRPNQMLDLLAIMGDASDNIPGLEGFGPKTAASLLQEFGTLDAVLAHPEKVKGEKKQQILRTQRETALMSRELARLKQDVTIPCDPAFYRPKEGRSNELREFYHQMKFLSLLREMSAEQPSAAKKIAEYSDYRLVDNESQLNELLAALSAAIEIGVDTETVGLHPMTAELIGIGLCRTPGEAFYVPCDGALGEKALKALRCFFSQYKGGLYGHNIKYDWHILQNAEIEIPRITFDTVLASYLLKPQNRRHYLDDLVLEYLQKQKIPITELTGKGRQQRTMREAPIILVKDYCCEAVDCTARLKGIFEEKLAHTPLEHILHDIELPLIPILAKMERKGIYLDRDRLARYGQVLEKKIRYLQEEIFQQTQEEFNLNSPQQLSHILFDKMGLQIFGRKRSTAADVLEELATIYPIARLILEYRTLEKMRSTYVEAIPNEINPRTGRIHCTFNQSVTATGRLSCQDPNLQNIPIRGEHGLRIRECFQPQYPNWSFVGADYSQIELRLLAHFSEEPALINAFCHGEDIHAHTASLVFSVHSSDVTPEMRTQAKAINFGILYGQGPYGLSRQTGLSFFEASQFIKKYFERYPRVAEYLEKSKEEARRTGVAKTIMGRTRPISEIDNKNQAIRSAAERLAVNTPLQGTAADLIKIAMIAIDRAISDRLLKGAMILQIHDELIFEVPDEEVAVFEHLVREKMENVFRLKVPLAISLSIGKNWGEC
jgi:DNA polymerase-1